MRRRFAAGTEIVRRGDDAVSQMVLPEPIDDHAGDDLAGPVIGIGDPVRQGRAAERGAGTRRRRDGPVFFRVGRTHQDLQVTERGLALLLVDVAPLQEECLLEKVVSLAVQADGGRPSLATSTFSSFDPLGPRGSETSLRTVVVNAESSR